MSIHPEAASLIVQFEGCARRVGPDLFEPYLDAVGVPTIGIGSTINSDGSRVKMTDPRKTRADCQALFEGELAKRYEPAVDRLISVPLHPLSRGALVSFTYNCGEGALRGSNLRKAVNQRRWDDVPREFAKWRMGGGRVLRGLERRRTAEAALFMRGVALGADLEAAAPIPAPAPSPPPAPFPGPAERSLWRRGWDFIFGKRT